MKQLRNRVDFQEEVDFILNNLSQTDKNEFLKQLSTSVLSGGDNVNLILSWKEIAEINADPLRKQKLQKRQLKLIRILGRKNA